VKQSVRLEPEPNSPALQWSLEIKHQLDGLARQGFEMVVQVFVSFDGEVDRLNSRRLASLRDRLIESQHARPMGVEKGRLRRLLLQDACEQPTT
jgi:hypothetical protein